MLNRLLRKFLTVPDEVSRNGWLRYHPVIGWTLAPNLRIAWPDGSLTTDDHGTRLPTPVVRPLPVGSIVACGDSFTAGSGVSDEEAWPAILESLVGKPVVNPSCGGWATDQIVLRAEEMLDLVHPTTLIVSFLWSDIERAEFRVYGRAEKSYFELVDGKLVHRNVPVPRAPASKLIRRRKKRDYWRVVPEGHGIEVTTQLVSRLKATAEGRGVRLILVVQYGGGDVVNGEQPVPARRLVEHTHAIGLQTIDLWDALMARAGEVRSLFLDEQGALGHMNGPGNRLVAEMVAAQLART